MVGGWGRHCRSICRKEGSEDGTEGRGRQRKSEGHKPKKRSGFYVLEANRHLIGMCMWPNHLVSLFQACCAIAHNLISPSSPGAGRCTGPSRRPWQPDNAVQCNSRGNKAAANLRPKDRVRLHISTLFIAQRPIRGSFTVAPEGFPTNYVARDVNPNCIQ